VCNGTPLTIEYTAEVVDLAHERGLQVHLDGARVFNAAAALGMDVQDVVRDVDSVMFCLSKGLCAPVGSLLCGSADFITEARRARKVVGGGMRQAGVLAAAGIVALEQIADRLGEDHARAKRLAQGLAQIPGVEVKPVTSNILYFDLKGELSQTPEAVVSGLADRGVLLLSRLEGLFRAVTHYWITDEDIEYAIQAAEQVLAS
jgi:threonine aldolase